MMKLIHHCPAAISYYSNKMLMMWWTIWTTTVTNPLAASARYDKNPHQHDFSLMTYRFKTTFLSFFFPFAVSAVRVASLTHVASLSVLRLSLLGPPGLSQPMARHVHTGLFPVLCLSVRVSHSAHQDCSVVDAGKSRHGHRFVDDSGVDLPSRSDCSDNYCTLEITNRPRAGYFTVDEHRPLLDALHPPQPLCDNITTLLWRATGHGRVRCADDVLYVSPRSSQSCGELFAGSDARRCSWLRVLFYWYASAFYIHNPH